MDQVLQLVGTFLILIAYALAQLGTLAPRGVPFLLLNLSGALILAASACTRNNGDSSCSSLLGRSFRRPACSAGVPARGGLVAQDWAAAGTAAPAGALLSQ